MKHITVAYATMSDYYYVCVSMVSILCTAKNDTFVDFIVLHSDDFTEQDAVGLNRILENYDNYSVNFVDVGHYTFLDSHVHFIAKATYYRLVMAEVLNVDKCLYLDGDTIVCEDLQELFQTDMTGFCLAGVKAVSYHRDEIDPEYCKKAHLPDKRQYVNAGVVLMNLALIRERNLTKEFLRRMMLELPSQDQDVLNGACYGAIRCLPFRYNVMTKYADLPLSGYHKCFTYEEILEAWNHPTIIHYADRWKPWQSPSMVFGDRWWQVCRQHEVLVNYFFQKQRSSILYHAAYQNARQPRLFDLSFAGRMMLWGAGEIAQNLIRQLREQETQPICCIISDGYGKYNRSELLGVPVRELHEVTEDVSDVTLVLAVKKDFRQETFLAAEQKGFRRIICTSDI